MESKTNNIEIIISELLEKEEISFNDEIENKDNEESMKLQILKIICYNNGKLSIENLSKFDYPDQLVNSFMLFLQKLEKLNLKDMMSSYEPEQYSEIKKNKLFQIYLNLTKKELLPFFFMIGFYSYIIRRKNTINEIKEFQSNEYFKNINNLYINIKILSLPKIIYHYSNVILSSNESFSKEGKKELDEKQLTNEEFEIMLNSYIIFNELYIKGDSFYLFESIFSSITNSINSIYLTKGVEFKIVNNLIDILFENIFEFIKLGFYEDNDIKILVQNLYESIKEYLSYSLDINYILFVDTYCNKFRQDKMDEKLYLVCSFFKGLNPLIFDNTFKNINYKYGKDHFNNIDKYYAQIMEKNEKNLVQKNEDSKLRVEKGILINDQIIEKTQKQEYKITKLCPINENNDNLKNKENYISKISSINEIKIRGEELPKSSDENEISNNVDETMKKEKNEINNRLNNINIVNQSNKLNNDKMEILIKEEQDEDNRLLILKDKKIKLEFELANKSEIIKESKKIEKELMKKLEYTENNLLENKVKLKESQNNLRKLQKEFKDFKAKTSSKNLCIDAKNLQSPIPIHIKKNKTIN